MPTADKRGNDGAAIGRVRGALMSSLQEKECSLTDIDFKSWICFDSFLVQKLTDLKFQKLKIKLGESIYTQGKRTGRRMKSGRGKLPEKCGGNRFELCLSKVANPTAVCTRFAGLGR